MGISGIIEFATIKKTPRESRHGRASPAMCGDHAVELTQLTFTAGRSTGWRLQLKRTAYATRSLPSTQRTGCRVFLARRDVECGVLGKERV